MTDLETDAVEAVRALIRIPSVNTGDPATTGDGETIAARWVQAQLDALGVPSEFVEPTPGRGSLVARLRGSDPDAGALLVHAHLDVVPVVEDDWTHPPFAAEIAHVDGIGDVLYGRGAVDMKNFAGVLVAVLRDFVRRGVVPRRDIVFAWVADEESGGLHGASWLVDNRPDLFDGVTEGLSEVGGYSITDADGRRTYLLATAEKGVAGALLTARGESAHASRPSPDDPVVRLARAVVRIGEHRFPVVRGEAVGALLDAFALDPDDLSSLGFTASVVEASLRNTVAPTVLRAGEKSNIIPGEASAGIDIRVLPGEDDALRAAIVRLAGDDVDVEWRNWWSATEAPLEGPLPAAIRAAIAAEDPDATVVPYLLQASTDNKHFARLGIAGYGFVPMRVPAGFDVFGQFHAADERIPVESLRFCARTVSRLLRTA